jgi:hypothetical protein
MIARWKRLDRPTLIAIGKRLRAQYEAHAAAPMSAELLAAVAKFETMLRENANSGTVSRLPRGKVSTARGPETITRPVTGLPQTPKPDPPHMPAWPR